MIKMLFFLVPVTDKIMDPQPHQDVHILIPGTWNYGTLHSEGDFANMIKNRGTENFVIKNVLITNNNYKIVIK